MNIDNLQDLVDMLGKEKVDKLFVEYMLIKIAKANNFDTLASKIDVNSYLIRDDSE